MFKCQLINEVNRDLELRHNSWSSPASISTGIRNGTSKLTPFKIKAHAFKMNKLLLFIFT